MNEICERAETFEDRVCDRTKAVFEYFGLPFDAEANWPISAISPQ